MFLIFSFISLNILSLSKFFFTIFWHSYDVFFVSFSMLACLFLFSWALSEQILSGLMFCGLPDSFQPVFPLSYFLSFGSARQCKWYKLETQITWWKTSKNGLSENFFSLLRIQTKTNIFHCFSLYWQVDFSWSTISAGHVVLWGSFLAYNRSQGLHFSTHFDWCLFGYSHMTIVVANAPKSAIASLKD
jgi:hypothetical protein